MITKRKKRFPKGWVNDRGGKSWQELPEAKQTLQPTTLLFNRNHLFIYRINWTDRNCDLLSHLWTDWQLLEWQSRFKTSPVFPVKLALIWFRRTFPANTPRFVTYPSSIVETFLKTKGHKLFFVDELKLVLLWTVKPQGLLRHIYTVLTHTFIFISKIQPKTCPLSYQNMLWTYFSSTCHAKHNCMLAS